MIEFGKVRTHVDAQIERIEFDIVEVLLLGDRTTTKKMSIAIESNTSKMII